MPRDHDDAGELRLERDSELQREILHSIVEHLDDGVVVADASGHLVLFNPAAETILGLGVTDAEPRRWSEVYGIYRPDRVTPFPWDELPLVQALAGNAVRDVEMFIRHARVPDGVFIRVTATPLSGSGRGAVAVFRDVTHRKHAEEAKRLLDLAHRQTEARRVVEAELERIRDTLVRRTRLSAIGELAASVAHDLRNPLGAIRNSQFYLSRRVPDGNPDWTRHLTIIENETLRANRIIDTLLEMSRGRAPIKERVDLAQAIRESFAPEQADSKLEVELRLVPEPFFVHADPGQLRRVIGNLLTNAIQATGGSGRIVVEARQDADFDVIGVTDDGPGIPEPLHERVFEPLFTTRAKGTGLGLAICRQICERHGGSIELVPGAGAGASFSVRLPRPAP